MLLTDHVLVFGELLLRFSASGNEFITENHTVSLFPGGSEANVSASLGQLGVPVNYLTCAPDNALAKSALGSLNKLGVDTGHTLFQGPRLGLYFLQSANGLSSGQVVYDRKFSSFSELRPGTIDWDTVMDGKTWFHWTALSPALNPHMADVCLEALQAARKKGLTISVDLNYRNRLWDFGKEPLEIMPQLVAYCDVIMGNIWAANKMLGTSVDSDLTRETSAKKYLENATKSAMEVFGLFPHCRHVANTFRFMDNPNHNLFYGTYHTHSENYISDILETHEVADRIGSGDAFMAGLIYGIVRQLDGQQIIDTATRSGYNKLFVKGDFGDGSIINKS